MSSTTFLHKSPTNGLASSFKDQIQSINLKLAALGQPGVQAEENTKVLDLFEPVIENLKEKNRLLSSHLCPADRRIQTYLNDVFIRNKLSPVTLPSQTFILDRPGQARTLSLPFEDDSFTSSLVQTFRIKQGILHNPKNDRRTTKGSFHVAEGGLPIAHDKLTVPLVTFHKLFEASLRPPADMLTLPFTSKQKLKARLLVSLYLRPMVYPPIPKVSEPKRLEIRFFAPGGLIGNLDFVESIFGNAGDPHLPRCDAGLDPEHWTGHTGCVILAPHLIHLKKKDLGLPSYRKATERQRRDGMYWKKETDLYNDGNPFKVTCRDERGVMVTLIADNYFGYCKKEVKTQISYSANLSGLSEEEHSGGAITFPSYILGQDFSSEGRLEQINSQSLKDVVKLYGSHIEMRPEGYGVDKKFPSILYVPKDAAFHINTQSVSWHKNGKKRTLKLLLDHTYVYPSGYKVHMEKQVGGPAWRLVGTVAEGTFCHKPSTVSGGGKSEISKPISYAMIQGPIFINDFHKDFDKVERILAKDFSHIYRTKSKEHRSHRPILSLDRSLGSVVKLFTPSAEYTDKHNAWLASLPNTLRQLVLVVKRYYRPSWGKNWREQFSADQVNGKPGHELKLGSHKLVANYLRMGYEPDGSWRIFKLRPDFHASEKVQMEDDITASLVVPTKSLGLLDPAYTNKSIKISANCENKLFQRPDDCIHRGFDKQAESDLATPGTFLSNFEPMERPEAKEILDSIIEFDQYSRPMKKLILDFITDQNPRYFVSSAHPRLVNGKRSKNPRYLQNRPDLVNAKQTYLGDVGIRLARRLPSSKPVYKPVNAVLAGRRNNPPDRKLGIPPLAVYNPIHYQELPELFMDFICSLTGKSPSTTGFGTEGALTKGPFNALWPIVDLNNALVSYVLTGYDGFTSAAGTVGPYCRMDHDFSLLVPEIWSRMKVSERDPAYLIKNGLLEKCKDFKFRKRTILASRLGYRITRRFVDHFMGRIFETPNAVFPEELLKPELQDMEMFVEGVHSICLTMEAVAKNYIKDGSIEAACPPLKALITIMAKGTYKGKGIHHKDIRNLFTYDAVIKSDWYKERLRTQQNRDIQLWTSHVSYLKNFRADPTHAESVKKLNIEDRIKKAEKKRQQVSSPAYLKHLVGTIGADPFHHQLNKKS